MEVVSDIKNAAINQLTVDKLTELLEKAKTGELESIMFVDKYSDGCCGYGWSGSLDRKMIAAMEEMKFDIHAEMFFPNILDE